MSFVIQKCWSDGLSLGAAYRYEIPEQVTGACFFAAMIWLLGEGAASFARFMPNSAFNEPNKRVYKKDGFLYIVTKVNG